MTDNTFKIEPFQKQPSDCSFLYRYLTIDKLLDFLISGGIPLVRLAEFDDRLEGTEIQHLILNFAGDKMSDQFKSQALGGTFKYITTNFFPTKRNNYRRQRKIFQNTNFANCWYESNHESVAMWQLYSRRDSVAIRIPYGVLTNELKNYEFTLPKVDSERLRFGSIEYRRFNDIDDLSDLATKNDMSGFLKDASFAHENEFRIILETENKKTKKVKPSEVMLDEQIENLNNQNNQKVIPLKLNKCKDLPFEIISHPQSYDWHISNLVKIMSKFDIKYSLIKSTLRDVFR